MDEKWSWNQIIKRKGIEIKVVGSIPTKSGLPPLQVKTGKKPVFCFIVLGLSIYFFLPLKLLIKSKFIGNLPCNFFTIKSTVKKV